MKYIVKMRVTLENTIVSETYEVEASSVDEAGARVLEGGGELKEDDIIDYGDTIEETVTSVTTIEE